MSEKPLLYVEEEERAVLSLYQSARNLALRIVQEDLYYCSPPHGMSTADVKQSLIQQYNVSPEDNEFIGLFCVT
jgi:hypothetical protein